MCKLMNVTGLVFILLQIAAVGNAQTIPDATISNLLSQLANTDSTVREDAFYTLVDLGSGSNVATTTYGVPQEIQNILQRTSATSADQIRVSLIALLSSENNRVSQSYQPMNLTVLLTEDDVNYYADLIAAVVALGDSRSIPSLVGALRSGDMATGALASFGDLSIDVLIQQLSNSDVSIQFPAVFALEEMLDPSNFPNLSASSKAKLRQAFILAAGFSDPDTASEATQALAKLNGLVGSDIIPPVTTAVASPAPNGVGWNNSNVTITLDSTDNEQGGSGVKQIQWSLAGAQTGSSTVPGSTTTVTISTEGTTTLSYFGTDNAGNIETAKTVTIKLDKTPPTINGSRTPPPNANGWSNTNVIISFQCADSLSGLATGSPPAPTTLSSEGAGQSATGTCTDVAGNSASATVNGINIDKTPPTVACSARPNILWPPNNKLVPVSVSVNVTDALSGSAGVTLVSVTSNEPDSGQGDIQGFLTGTASTSGQLRAQRLGSGTGRVYTLTYSGADRAGNTASCTSTVSVPHDQGQN